MQHHLRYHRSIEINDDSDHFVDSHEESVLLSCSRNKTFGLCVESLVKRGDIYIIDGARSYVDAYVEICRIFHCLIYVGEDDVEGLGFLGMKAMR